MQQQQQQPAWPRVPRVLAMAKSAQGGSSLVYKMASPSPSSAPGGASTSCSGLTGLSSTLSAGVRGHGNAVTMERSEEERQKFPDRINLDRKGLQGKGLFPIQGDA